VIKYLLQNRLATTLNAFEDILHVVDGLPMPVCKFARAYFSRVFKGKAAYGYCAAKKERYYGFRGHITERFHIEKVRARDIWHQFSRFWRKLLAHTVSIKLSLIEGNEPLQFEHLIEY